MAPKAFDLGTLPEDPSVVENSPVRVTYHDTDQMGHVYYGNYLTWFEMGRTEWLRSRGYTYREMEESGVYLPVKECWAEYVRPAFYDDELRIATWVAEVRRASLRFGYEIHSDARKELIARGWTQHAFVTRDRRVVSAPAAILAILKGESR